MNVHPRGNRRPALALACVAVAALAACADSAKKADEEAAKNTIACQMGSDRVVIRFDAGEARLLIAGADRVTLYQIPAGTNLRYSNGMLELRSKGTGFEMVRFGTPVPLTDCGPYAPPK